MSTYRDVTQPIGDQWTAALRQAGEAVAAVSSGIGSVVETAANLGSKLQPS